METFIMNSIIQFLDKVKFNNPKTYAWVAVLLGLLFVAQAVLPLFGVQVPEGILINISEAIAGIFLAIANPKTNRYLIEKNLKTKEAYTVDIKANQETGES